MWINILFIEAIHLPLIKFRIIMNTGKVKFFNVTKGFGFVISDDDQKEYFVHATGLTDKIQDNEIPYLIEQLISNFNVLTDFIDLHHNSGSSKEEIIQLNFLSSNGQTNFKKNIVKKVDLMDQSETLKKKIEALLVAVCSKISL